MRVSEDNIKCGLSGHSVQSFKTGQRDFFGSGVCMNMFHATSILIIKMNLWPNGCSVFIF